MDYAVMGNNELLGYFAKTRDEAAFRVFYNRHNNDLRGFLLILCQVAPRDISDHLQSVWLRVIDKVHLYDPEQSATLWLNTLAKNIKNRIWEQSTTLSRGGINTRHFHLGDKRFENEDLIVDHRTGRTSPDPSTQMIKKEQPLIEEEQRRQIHEAVEKLSPPMKEAVTMVFFDGISSTKAAHLIGIPHRTFAMRLHRGKKSLYNLLRVKEDEFVTGG